MARSTGKAWERDCRKALDRAGLVYRLNDGYSRNRNGRNVGAQSAADYVLIQNSGSHLIESKAVKGTRLAYDRLASHQEAVLLRHAEIGVGHGAWLAILFYDLPTRVCLPVRYRNKRQAVLVHVDDWRNARDSGPEKSLHVEAALVHGFAFSWERGAGWVAPEAILGGS